MRFTLIILTFAALVALVLSSQREEQLRYDNYAVYKLKFRNDKERLLLEKLAENVQNFNIWNSDRAGMDLMVKPSALKHFLSFTRLIGIKVELMVPDVQRLIDEEQISTRIDDNDNFGWTRYYPLSNIEAWLDGILAAYPAVTEGFIVGKSYEGRTIRGIKISYKSGNPGFFVESNIHAREWITSATSTWLINELLTSQKAEVRELAENVDWYIVPVFNVDGFVYTHETNRMWRKTRQPTAGSACMGADLNRNWDSHWMEGGGASSDPCSESFAGPKPFSEVETKALSEYIASIKERINILTAFHSYGQYLLSPWGHTQELPPNVNDLMAVAKAYADAVESLPYKTKYTYGTSANTLYFASGKTNDWAYNTQDVKITYTIEFRDEGRYGFILPPVQIIPNCEEVLAGIIAMVKQATALGIMVPKYSVA